MLTHPPVLALIPNLGPLEISLILIAAVLLFGRRLPDVGRNVGKAIIEFKRGVKGITDDIEDEAGKSADAGRAGTPELDAPRGTAYHDPIPTDAVDPSLSEGSSSGDGQPRTS